MTGERYTERFWTSIKPKHPQPASTCGTCFKPGTVSDNQDGTGTSRLKGTIRFECTSGHAWTVNARDAEAHGRFLTRLGRTP